MHDIIIIGGGISGLYLMRQLLNGDAQKIALLEKSDHVGGKLRTSYDAGGNIEFEKGPWRVSLNHHRMIHLCEKLNVDLKLIKKDANVFIDKKIQDIAIKDYKKDGGLSVYDTFLYSDSKTFADHVEDKTGYNEILDMTSSVNAYDANTKLESYYVLSRGFSFLIQKLVESLPTSHIFTDFFVRNVEKREDHYKIYSLHRVGSNQFREKIWRCKKMVIACPPSAFRSWSVVHHFNVLLAGISSYPLCHIYAKSSKKPRYAHHEDFHIFTSDVLSQIISTNYDNDWFQMSYSGGRIARFWDHLHLNHKNRWRKELATHLGKFLTIDVDAIRIYYWPDAIHMWLPSYHLNLERVYKLSLEPNPIECKNLFIIGEAFSKNQGWCEGALETVHDLLTLMHSTRDLLQLEFPFLIYKKRILDVSKWRNVHPGSRKAIENHLSQDVSLLWDTIHGSSYTQRQLLSLQVGWKDGDTYYEV